MSLDFDFAVIGAGSGGLVAAAAAAKFGQRVVLFEQDRMGGECLNTGCVPSKALLAAAQAAAHARKAAALGIIAEPNIDMPGVRAHLRAAIAAIEPHDSQARMESIGVRVVRATARFRDQRTLEADGEIFRARRMVIATGSLPALPEIAGLAQTPHLSNEGLFDLAELPRHLIVIGGGATGVEMAQAHRRLGSDVTVLESATLLGRDDPELVAVVARQLAEDGVIVKTGCRVASVGHGAEGFAVRLGDGASVQGSHLLVAAGRRPNIEDLNLAAAGIQYSAQGIAVDCAMRTSNRRVYAVGDCSGGPLFTHAAAHQAGIVIRHALFRLPADAMRAVMPRVTYCDPELAQAGLSEAEARDLHGDSITVLRRPFADNDRAITEGDRGGFVKIVAGRGGRILGVGIVGSGAGDLIQPWLVAMNNRLRLKNMLRTVTAYPTRSDAGQQAALDYYAGLAGNSWLRRAIRLLGAMG